MLRAYIERVDTQARQLRVKLPPTAFLFTSAPDGSEPLVPDTATQRYVPTLLALHRNDVALISFGDFPMASALQPPLTVVDQDAYAFGRQAANRLFGSRRTHGLSGRCCRSGYRRCWPSHPRCPPVR